MKPHVFMTQRSMTRRPLTGRVFSGGRLRRRIVSGFAAVLAVMMPALGWAQGASETWPTRSVRLIVPLPPGGAPDTLGRVLAERFSLAWGQPVVVENVPGVAGNIGVERAARSPADGYTLLLSGDAAIVVNVTLFKSLPYDPVRDLTPISLVSVTPNILVVNPAIPARTMVELAAYAGANPGKLNAASSGIGTSQHLGLEQFKSIAGIDIAHVPYRDPYMNDLLGNHVNMAYANIVIALPQIRAGKLVALAVGDQNRLSVAPDIPTTAEAGFPGMNAHPWFGVLAPAGVPAPIVRKVHASVTAALAEPAVREKLTGMGMRLIGSSPEAFGAFIKAEIPRMAEVIRQSGARVE